MSNLSFANREGRPIDATDTQIITDKNGKKWLYKWSDINFFVDSTTGAITATTIDATSNVTIGGNLTMSGSILGKQLRNITAIASATYDLLTTDYILLVNYTATGAVTITLPTAQCEKGRIIQIKDAGNASTNNITVETEGSETIDGDSTLTIGADYMARTLCSDGVNWYII